MLRSRYVPGTHGIPDRRRVREPWDATPHGRIGGSDADVAPATRGCSRTTAIATPRFARCAEPKRWRLRRRGVCGRSPREASLAAAFGERGSAREHAALASEIAQGVDWSATTGEERIALLLLAEISAVTDPAAARAALETYDALPAPIDPGTSSAPTRGSAPSRTTCAGSSCATAARRRLRRSA